MKMFSTRFLTVLALALYAYNACAAPVQVGDFAGIDSPLDLDFRRDIKQPGEGVVVNNIALDDVAALNNLNARDDIKQPGEGIVVNNIALKDVDILNNFNTRDIKQPGEGVVVNNVALKDVDVLNNAHPKRDTINFARFEALVYKLAKALQQNVGKDIATLLHDFYVTLSTAELDGIDVNNLIDEAVKKASLETAKRCEPALINVGNVDVLSHDQLVGHKRGGSVPVKVGNIGIIKDNELVDRKRDELPNVAELGNINIFQNNEAIDRKRDILNDLGSVIGKTVGKVWRTVFPADTAEDSAESS